MIILRNLGIKEGWRINIPKFLGSLDRKNVNKHFQNP